jgi:hypothetical protein
MFKIKAGFPPSTSSSTVVGRRKYPFEEMKIGTYFEVPSSNPSSKNGKSSKVPLAAAAAYQYGYHNNQVFTMRRTPTGNIRIYRVG